MTIDYIFISMHVITFFLSYGLFNFLYKDGHAFDAQFSKYILFFEITFYISLSFFVIGFGIIGFFISFQFLLVEVLSFIILVTLIKLFLSEFFG